MQVLNVNITDDQENREPNLHNTKNNRDQRIVKRKEIDQQTSKLSSSKSHDSIV